MPSNDPQNEATALLADHMDRLRGRLLGMVEAVGFPSRQEAGIKQLLKSLTYDSQRELGEILNSMSTELAELRFRMDGLEK